MWHLVNYSNHRNSWFSSSNWRFIGWSNNCGGSYNCNTARPFYCCKFGAFATQQASLKSFQLHCKLIKFANSAAPYWCWWFSLRWADTEKHFENNRLLSISICEEETYALKKINVEEDLRLH